MLDDLLARADSLGAHPDTLGLLVGIMDDPLVDAQALVPVVVRDPVLTAALLKLCNSSLYNYQRQIGSVREALVMVGDRAFTAGLLHDIGKLLLDPELAAARTGRAPGRADPGGEVTLGDERELAGLDHAEVGGALLEHWRLPPAICDAVRWHHVPELAGEHVRLAEAVHYAERIAHHASDLQGAAASVDDWVIETLDAALVPVEAARRLVGSVLTRQGNVLALAAAPIG